MATTTAIGTAATASKPAGGITTARLGGLAALGFAAGVLISNAALAGGPMAGTEPGEAASWFDANRARAMLAASTVALNLPLLAIFAVAMTELARADERARFWSRVGAVGAIGMIGVFAIVTTGKIAVTLLAESGATDAFIVAFAVQNAAFAVNMTVLGTAFLGFSIGAHAAGLIPAWQRSVGVLGALLLLTTGLANTAVADGSLIALAGFGGFILWLFWLVITGVRLLRYGG